MELHVGAHHFPVGRQAFPTAFRAFIIWFAIRWHRRAAAAAEQQNHKQLQQIRPHVHTRPENRSSIGEARNLWVLNKADGQLIQSMLAMKRWPEIHSTLKTQHLPVLAQLSLPPPFLARLSPCSAQRCPSLFAKRLIYNSLPILVWCSFPSTLRSHDFYMPRVRAGYWITCPVVERFSLLPRAWAPIQTAVFSTGGGCSSPRLSALTSGNAAKPFFFFF